MKRLIPLFCMSLMAFAPSAQAATLYIAAAADLQYALRNLIQQFTLTNKNHQIEVTYGSSGKFYTLISNGAPYDMYFSANIDYPNKLVAEGLADGEVRRYGIGRLVLWHPHSISGKLTLQDLSKSLFTHIAIANPKHAPYGQRAQEALQKSGMWAQLKGKLVFGENVSQAAQFVQSGNAQVGIIALALAKSPELKLRGNYSFVPSHLYTPLDQGYIILKTAANKPLARAFADFLETPTAKDILYEYGFSKPDNPYDINNDDNTDVDTQSSSPSINTQ